MKWIDDARPSKSTLDDEMDFARLYETELYANLVTEPLNTGGVMSGSTYSHRPRRARGSRGNYHPWRSAFRK